MGGERKSLSESHMRCINRNPSPEFEEAMVVSRFWRNVNRLGADECWLWEGDFDKDGYGTFFYHGRNRRAHELALSFTSGEARIPELDTCHSCDIPACCNPGHLRFDTQQSNVDDSVKRGRKPRGSQVSALTEDDVLIMRRRRASGARCTDLARDFSIAASAVTAIVTGRTWKHVGGPLTNRGIGPRIKEEKENV